jgi:stage V sporulation protein B
MIIGGLLTRLLGFIIKIIYTRIIGPEGIKLFSLVMPTYSMLLTITSLAMPIALSKLVAEHKKRYLKLFTNATFIIIVLNIIVLLVLTLSSSFIACHLLNNCSVKPLLIAMTLTLPFVSLSSVIKGYFNGNQNTMPYMISNVLEQLLRLILIWLILPRLYAKSVFCAVKGLLLLSIISETFSIFIFTIFMPKKFKIDVKSVKPDFETQKEILNIALPTVSSRIIGNIGYFLEPIILTNFLQFNGYSLDYILTEYASYNAYAISILTIPAFFIVAVSTTIIPEVSKYLEVRNTRMVKKRVNQSIKFTFLIGIIFSFLIIIFRDKILMLLYNTTKGSNYILILAPFFSLFYLENIFYSILQASNNAQYALKITTKGVILKTALMFILCFCHIGIYALVISEIINIIYIILANYHIIKKNGLI